MTLHILAIAVLLAGSAALAGILVHSASQARRIRDRVGQTLAARS